MAVTLAIEPLPPLKRREVELTKGAVNFVIRKARHPGAAREAGLCHAAPAANERHRHRRKGNMKQQVRRKSAALMIAGFVACSVSLAAPGVLAASAWSPGKPVELVVPSDSGDKAV